MRIAVLDDYQGRAHTWADWDSLGAELTFFQKPIADLAATLEPFEVLVLMRERTRFDADTLRALGNLKLVVTTGMKNASLDVAYLQSAGIPVCGTGIPGYQRDLTGVASTAEIAWALIFATAKRVVWEDRELRAGVWQRDLPLNLAGLTIGLAGLGRLGAQMVAPAKAFGMNVIAWSQNLTPQRAAEAGASAVSLDQLLERSDVLSIHLVLSRRTRGLFGAEQLARLKDGAILINTSRGPIVDAAALVAELGRGRIAAGLDVYDTEPLGAGDPILSAPNTVLTPHLGYVSEPGLADMYTQAVEDIAAWQAGAPIRLLS